MSELSRKNDSELRKTLFEKRRLWHEFRFGAAGSRIRNTREGRHLRRDIARILTEIRKRNSPTKPTDALTTPTPEVDTKK